MVDERMKRSSVDSFDRASSSLEERNTTESPFVAGEDGKQSISAEHSSVDSTEVGESSHDESYLFSTQLQTGIHTKPQEAFGDLGSSASSQVPSEASKVAKSSNKDNTGREKSGSEDGKREAMPRIESFQSFESVTRKATNRQDSLDTGMSASPTTEGSNASQNEKVQPSSTDGAPPKVITLGHSKRHANKLRRGKWTVEEEAYVARVIQDFNSGFLDAPAGTTLRTFLSEKLQCDPMRITKKFTGDSCIGKRVFHPAVRSPSNAGVIDKAQAELAVLERRWQRRIEMQQRDSSRKAAASAAAAAAAVTGRIPTLSSIDHSDASLPASQSLSGTNAVSRTASWLDRAKSVLKDPRDSAQDSQASPDSESDISRQIKEVQSLIYEGPVIQQSSAGIPEILDKVQERSPSPGSPQEPADKRPRTGAEDAEALVGFLRSVRASAASGEEF